MPKSKFSTWRYWYQEWLKPITIALVLALVIRTFIVQPFRIPSNSMVPTFKPGDRIFVSKFVYGAKVPFVDHRLPKVREPRTGDLVVFFSPVEDGKYLVKRYIAGGGQKVRIHRGDIYIDGEKIDEGPISDFYYYNYSGPYGTEDHFLVPEDTFFVLGDNSANSKDSRYWGFVPEENIVGRVFLIYLPLHRMRVLGEDD